jgi:hypothetical protein
MNDIYGCFICQKKCDLSLQPVPDADNMVLFNFHSGENMTILLCSKSCTDQFVFPMACGCVICDKMCTDAHWFVNMKFINLGGWMSMKACCSEDCKNRILSEQTDEIGFQYVCWACKKPSKTQIKRCGRCRIAYYCDQECQKKHWLEHKKTCTPPE